jgi:hypothetical protein
MKKTYEKPVLTNRGVLSPSQAPAPTPRISLIDLS